MHDHGGTPITSLRELEDVVGVPIPLVVDKVHDRLTEQDRAMLAASPLYFIGTADAAGHADVSPKGDPAGFVHVLDDRTIALPDRPGNRRVDGFRNVLTNPEVALVFVIPGRADTLRVNGTARLLRDVPYVDALAVDGHRPTLVLEVSIREIFLHCPKAFLRSRAWDPTSWYADDPTRRARLLERVRSTDVTLADLEEPQGPRYADRLYV